MRLNLIIRIREIRSKKNRKIPQISYVRYFLLTIPYRTITISTYLSFKKMLIFFYLYLNKENLINHTRACDSFIIKIMLSQGRNINRTFGRKMGRTTFERPFDRRYVFHSAGL